MHSQNPRPEQRSDAGRNHALPEFIARLIAGRNGDPDRTLSRARKFLGYYRPYVPLLLADLACAVLVAASSNGT